MKKIVLTGGGTAGHVTPNIAMFPALKAAGYEILYVGSKKGMEKQMIEKEGIPYKGISSGKLRRYFDLKNFIDPFKVVHGYFEAKRFLRRERPDVIFSKGGFVSVPVVLAAKSLKIPAIIHESDMTPGLANRIAAKGASYFCCNFPETLEHLPADKSIVTGTPIRQELLSGSREAGLRFTGLDSNKPNLLIIGGSLGSKFVNDNVRASLDNLLKDFNVIHLCGKGHLDPSLDNREGYRQYEFISDELKDLFAMADIVVSRAGANAICELLALRIPNILIPLPAKSSRGDQLLNAASFEAQGFSMVIYEEELDTDTLLDKVHELFFNKQRYIDVMSKSGMHDSINTIMKLIDEAAERHIAEKSK
jgi:UDP-N-acetylglucosamine--N-acetylmuramyl-(pentapeptide) pyrophosphoryl-undecaprenol N-acetylglucosamine transferase